MHFNFRILFIYSNIFPTTTIDVLAERGWWHHAQRIPRL